MILPREGGSLTIWLTRPWIRGRLRTDLFLRGRVEQVDERPELLIRLRHRLEQLGRPAGEHDEAAPDRPMRVGAREQRVAVVVDPRLPEEVALLGIAGRVVGDLVEQPVDDAER